MSGSLLQLLRMPDLRRVIVLRALGLAATQVINVSVSWQAYVMTGRAVVLGYIGLVQFLPTLVLAPFSGIAADTLDRRRLSAAASSVSALAAMGLWWVAHQQLRIEWMLVMLVLISAGRIFAFPTQLAMLTDVAPREELGRAIALGSTINKIALITGPAVGGVLLAIGADVSFAVGFGMMLLCAVLALRVRLPRRAKVTRPTLSLREALSGVPFVFGRPLLLGAMSLDLMATLLGGAVALLPIYVRDILHVGPEYLGVLRSAPAIGSVIMAMVLAQSPAGRTAGKFMLISAGVYGAATVVFGVSTSLWLSLCMLMTLGAADMYSTIVRQTVVQLNTPDAMRGRVNAISSVFINASNQLGQFESGLTAAWFGTVPSVVIGGVGSMLVALVWAWRFPVLRHIDLSQRSVIRTESGSSSTGESS